MFLGDHLQKIRRRLIICFASVLGTSTGSYVFAEELVRFIIAPAGILYYMNPAEAFFASLKVSLLAGIAANLLSCMVFCYASSRRNWAYSFNYSSDNFFRTIFSWIRFFLCLCITGRYQVFHGICHCRFATCDFNWSIPFFCNFISITFWFNYNTIPAGTNYTRE